MNQELKRLTVVTLLLHTTLTIVMPTVAMIESIFAITLIYASLHLRTSKITFSQATIALLLIQTTAILGVTHINPTLATILYLTVFYRSHFDNINS